MKSYNNISNKMRIILLILISSCSVYGFDFNPYTRVSLLPKLLNEILTDSTYDRLDPNLSTLISAYIQSQDGMYIEKEWIYYTLFFSPKDSSLTMWASTVFPDVYFRGAKKKYTYCLFEIQDRKVVFIFEDREKYKDLFTAGAENLKLAKYEKDKEYSGPIHDGDMYFISYQIIKLNDEYQFKKLKKANVSFLKRKPPDAYLH